MTALRRRAPFLLAALFIAACSSIVTPPRAPSASGSPSRPSLTPVPGGPTATPAATLPSTTGTEFGRIWDDVPSSFPRLSSSTVGESRAPVSAEFVEIVGDPSTASASIGRALTKQGWTIDVGSPLEDGTVVLDATGRAKGCKAEVRFTPLGGSVIMTVLYGAACPFT